MTLLTKLIGQNAVLSGPDTAPATSACWPKFQQRRLRRPCGHANRCAIPAICWRLHSQKCGTSLTAKAVNLTVSNLPLACTSCVATCSVQPAALQQRTTPARPAKVAAKTTLGLPTSTQGTNIIEIKSLKLCGDDLQYITSKQACDVSRETTLNQNQPVFQCLSCLPKSCKKWLSSAPRSWQQPMSHIWQDL